MILNIVTSSSAHVSTLEIYSLDGKIVISEKFNENRHKIDVTSLSKGTYLLRIYNAQKTITSKFIL